MFGIDDAVGAGLSVVNKLIDRVWQDPADRDKARLELLKMDQAGELETMRTQMSAIIAEAQSADPWTSRARPSFLYVIYLMILAAFPMGVIHAIHPGVADNITAGVQAWLAAIPQDLWWLFGAGYLGYAGLRTVDKRSIANTAASAKKAGGLLR